MESASRFLPVVCLVILAAAVSIKSIRSPDLWWHLAAGRWMVDHRALLDHDVFTFSSPGIPWINRTWLADVLFYLAWKSFGMFGIVMIPCILETGFFLTMAVVGKAVRRPAAFALLGLLTLAVAHVRILERPFLFSDLLAPMVILLWMRVRSGAGGKGTLALLVMIQLVWTHIHGGFVLGLLIAAVFTVGALVRHGSWIGIGEDRAPARRWLGALVLAAGVVAAVLTPWRGELLQNLWGFASRLAPGLTGNADLAVPEVARDAAAQAAPNTILEWLPTFSPAGRTALMPIFPFVVLAYGVIAWQLVRVFRMGRVRERLEEVLLLLAFSTLGAVSVRFPSTMVLAAFPLLWELSALRPERKPPSVRRSGGKRRPRAPAAPRNTRFLGERALVTLRFALAVLLLGLTGLVVSNVYWRHFRSPSEFGVTPIANLFPEHLVDWMDENRLQGRFFNSYNTGGYLIWRRPGHPVFTDSRLVSNQVYADYVAALRSPPQWKRVATQYGFEGALLRRRGDADQERLFQTLQSDPDWVLAYRDPQWAFFLTKEYLEHGPRESGIGG